MRVVECVLEVVVVAVAIAARPLGPTATDCEG